MSDTSTLDTSLITDRSGSSEAAGPAAVKWGFMCSLAARYGDRLYAVNFTRPPGVPWDATRPNEAPIAFWSRGADGRWSSILLDSPERTYQSPSLLLGPDGRANVFALYPGSGTLHWFRSTTSDNTAFERREIKMNWGAYLGGGIDPKGRALLVYWGNGGGDPHLEGRERMRSGYRQSTIGYTLVDTLTGQSKNGVIDRPGAPYCYSHVEYGRTGAHVLTVRSEVNTFPIVGSRNHYTDLRYYYCSDPADFRRMASGRASAGAKWRMTTVYRNERALIQPLGLVVDPAGRVHLLYYHKEELADGAVSPLKLVYAVSKEPVSAQAAPQFVHFELRYDWDGRLYLTQDGQVHILAYQAGTALEYCRVLDGPAGRFTNWESVKTETPHSRFFPLGTRGGSTLTADLEGVYTGLAGTPAQSSMFYFRLPPPQSRTAQNEEMVMAANPSPDTLPTLSVWGDESLTPGRKLTMVSAAFPNVPGLVCDSWCYESELDFVDACALDGGRLELRHRVRAQPRVLYVTTVTPEPGAVDIAVRAVLEKTGTGTLPDSLLTPNLCWQVRRASTFKSAPEPYPEFVKRCFLFTEKGPTHLDRTVRRKIPVRSADDPYNNPPWVQMYVGVWQETPETDPQAWADYSPDRYTNRVIGVVSRDGKYLAALANDSASVMAQAWHDCLHNNPAWMPADAPPEKRVWRLKIYAMANDPKALLARVEKDFPTKR